MFLWLVSTDGLISTMQTRKRVLINAFTVRALRDTFSPARGAGIRTLWYLSVATLTSLFMKFWALKIFLRFVKKIFLCIFHLQFFKCWMLINSNVVVLVSLWTNSKFYCVRDHGSMCHQCLLWRHWDCNSDSTKHRCTYHWSWQVNYSSNDLPIIILAIFLV